MQEVYTTFKEKHANVNIEISKFCAFRLKWCVLAGSKMTHSICIFSAQQNVVLLVDVMDWNLTYKYLIKKIVSNTESNKYILYQCESCPATSTLKNFLDQELNEHEDDKKFNYCQRDTKDQAILTTFTATCERMQRDFD